MSRFFTLVIGAILSLPVASTIQKPDKLIYEGQAFDLDDVEFLMEEYFEHHPEKKKAITIGLPWSSVSTNLWRGYVAIYEIKEAKLVLRDLEIRGPSHEIETYSGEWVSVIDRVFPNNKRPRIDWFSGLLILPIGEEVYSSVSSKHYGKYLVLDIQDGNLLSEYDIYGSPRDIRHAHQQDKLDTYANRQTVPCQVNDPDISGIYIGDCKDGFAHGVGIAVGRDEYRGDFFEGDVHGRGVYAWGPESDWDSELHEGFFGHGQKNGFGETTVSNSSSHVHLGWYKNNAKQEGEKFVLRGIFVDHAFVLACESPSDCQTIIEKRGVVGQ